jgi:DNA-binding MarR family transcriptional regulator
MSGEEAQWVEVVDRLLNVTGQLHARFAQVAAVHDLTPQQMMLIRSLVEPRSMSEVATQRACDPSNVTGLIDRLEKRGLVARSAGEADRRVKMLSLTAAGRKVLRDIDRDLAKATADYGNLDTAARNQLNRLLTRIESAAATKGRCP